MKTKGFNLLSWAALSLVLVLLDQYTKLLAVAHLKGKTPEYLNSCTRKTGELRLA